MFRATNHRSLSSYKKIELLETRGMKGMLEIPRRQRPDNLNTRCPEEVHNTSMFPALVKPFPHRDIAPS